MEYDRFKDNHKIYILGMVCLLLCLMLLFFSIYIIPFLLWGLHYDVPDFISHNITFLERDFNFSNGTSRLLVWLLYFIPALITGYISYYISNYFDNKIYETKVKDIEEVTAKETNKKIQESAVVGIKIIFLMIIVLVALFLLASLIAIV